MPNKENIVLKGRGHFIEGQLDTGVTAKPGQCLSLRTNGRYGLWDGAADGERDEVIILTEYDLLGLRMNDTYPSASQFRAYIPLPGDEIQVLVPAGENIAIGDKLIIDDTTGRSIETTGSPEMEPFKALESSGGALAVEALILVRATGC